MPTQKDSGSETLKSEKQADIVGTLKRRIVELEEMLANVSEE